jgi:hypothetical protein
VTLSQASVSVSLELAVQGATDVKICTLVSHHLDVRVSTHNLFQFFQWTYDLGEYSCRNAASILHAGMFEVFFVVHYMY